jgi:drug/metabolite transporter (DMT)-like permease
MVQFGTHVVTVYLIVQWVFFSSTIILFNKHILTGYKFPYPATLVLIHMLFASACCTTAKVLGLVDIPQLALRQWLTQILPVGLCFAVSLVLGNAAYLYISVAFVQMLKASTPVVVLLCSFAFGLEKPTFKLAGFIVLISAGISTACANEIDVSVIGVAVQMSAVGAEALRLCLVNMLLVSKGLRLSSLATLYYGEHARTPTRAQPPGAGRGRRGRCGGVWEA